jgi:hypothetical protein
MRVRTAAPTPSVARAPFTDDDLHVAARDSVERSGGGEFAATGCLQPVHDI